MNEVLQNKKLFIFDMDGTIYLGDRVFPFAVDFIQRLRRNGRQVLFFTNNASHSGVFYHEKLTRLGFEPLPGEILSAGDVTAAFLNLHRKGKTVFLLGTPQLASVFSDAGIPLLPVSAEKADIVVTSFDTTLTYEKLDAACRLIRGGAEYLCTHPDLNCPTENGFIPDSGAIAACVTASTGVEPRYFGKPYADTIDMICEVTGCTKQEMCVFGDRLYTDIALGRRHGVTATLVLSGETTKEQHEAAHDADKADFVYPSLAEVAVDMMLPL